MLVLVSVIRHQSRANELLTPFVWPIVIWVLRTRGIMLGPFLNLCNGPGFTNGTGKFVLRLSRTTISRFSFANGTRTLADISRHGHGLHLHLTARGETITDYCNPGDP